MKNKSMPRLLIDFYRQLPFDEFIKAEEEISLFPRKDTGTPGIFIEPKTRKTRLKK